MASWLSEMELSSVFKIQEVQNGFTIHIGGKVFVAKDIKSTLKILGDLMKEKSKEK